MNRAKFGIYSGAIATVTLSEVSLLLGMLATIVTLLCLVPTAILNWRSLRKDYNAFSRETNKSGFVYFMLYCFGGMRALRKESVAPFKDNL